MSSKGYRSQHEAAQEYLSRGWQVFVPPKVSKFGVQDIFNMFDLIALSPDGSEIHFVQVKSNSTRGFLKKLRTWQREHQVKTVRWRLLVRRDARKYKRKWDIYE